MRWPFSRSRSKDPAPPQTTNQPTTEQLPDGAVPTEEPTPAPSRLPALSDSARDAQTALTLTPVGDMPRADWAIVGNLAPSTSVHLGADAESFAASIAGRRSLRYTSEVPDRSRNAAAGLLLDMTDVQQVLPSEETNPRDDELEIEASGNPSPRRASVVEPAAPVMLRTAGVELHYEATPAQSSSLDQSGDEEFDPDSMIGLSWTAQGGLSGPAEVRRAVEELRHPGRAARPNETSEDSSNDETSSPATVRYVPTTTPRPQPASDEVEVPISVAQVVEQVTGVDVSDTEIVRTPTVTTRARDLEAHAYTEDGRVHLPAELGDLHAPDVQALLAHELTHVAQQRRVGNDLPSENSPAGMELEQQAQKVQRAVAALNTTPLFQRSGSAEPISPSGAVRLGASDGSSSSVQRAPFDWQNRDRPLEHEATREGIGSIFGFGFNRTSGDTAEDREASERDRNEQFETEYQQQLHAERADHAERLVVEAQRHVRAQVLRAMPDPTAFSSYPPERQQELVGLRPSEIMQLRETLDQERSLEFIDPQYRNLEMPAAPEEAADGDETNGNAEEETGNESQQNGTRRLANVPPVNTAPPAGGPSRLQHMNQSGPSSSSRRGGPPGSGRGPGPRPTRGSQDEEDPLAPLEWQLSDEEQAQQAENEESAQVAESLVGGGLLGAAFGAFFRGTPETGTPEEQQAAAVKTEQANAARLHQSREDREKELRIEKLRSKRANKLRSTDEAERAAAPHVTLSQNDKVSIRAKVDREMPLLELVPQYLPFPIASWINILDGTIGDGDPPAVEPTTANQQQSERQQTTSGDSQSTGEGSRQQNTSTGTNTESARNPNAAAEDSADEAPNAKTADPTQPTIEQTTSEGDAETVSEDPSNPLRRLTAMEVRRLETQLFPRFKELLRREIGLERDRVAHR